MVLIQEKLHQNASVCLTVAINIWNILDFLLFQRDSFLFIKNKMFCKILYLKECKYALQIVRCGNINIFVQSELFALKVVPATFLLVCFLSVKENTCETRKNIFHFFH